MKEKKRIPTDGEPIAWTSPFAGLKQMEHSQALPKQPVADHSASSVGPKKSRGRVDIIRQKAHRGGKTVRQWLGEVDTSGIEVADENRDWWKATK